MSVDLVDNFGRSIEYLRISVTDRCNLRCTYCMPASGVPYENSDQVLTADEIVRIVALLSCHGLRKVRLTGGEPLIRKDIVSILSRINKIPQIRETTLTTNAVLLDKLAKPLWNAGLRRINISLDSLRPEKFAEITRFEKIDSVLKGIETAANCGFDPIKLNMVVMRGINDDEVTAMAMLTIDKPFVMRFLEYMPIGQVTKWQWKSLYVSNEEVLASLRSNFELNSLECDSSSTSTAYKIAGARGTIGLINPISHRFCSGCNRLRLTANGSLVPCLSDNFEYDLKGPLRAGASDAELLTHIRIALSKKPFESDFEGRANRGGSLRIMAQIGG